jgi:hypothetical protein
METGQVSAMQLRTGFAAALLIVGLLWSGCSAAAPVAVRYREGLLHGFLSLRSSDGEILAIGDLMQTAKDDRVTSRLVFHFKDKSINDETVVYSQSGHFKLLNYKLIQKGPLFSQPLVMTIDAPANRVTVRYQDKHGKEKIKDTRISLPPDLANGMLVTLLKNLRQGELPSRVSFIAATPKPRLVKLNIASGGADRFSIGDSPRQAAHYIIKVDIGGIAGAVAPLVGKQPPDSHVWILEGEAPVVVRARTQFFNEGPVWQMDLVGPVWPGGR